MGAVMLRRYALHLQIPAAMIALTGLYNAPLLLRASDITVLLTPSADVLALLIILCAASIGTSLRRRLYVPLSALYLAALAFRAADAFVPAVYDRKLTVYTDIRYVRDLFNFIKAAVPTALIIAAGAGGTIAAVLLSGSVWQAIKTIATRLRPADHRASALAAGGALAIASISAPIVRGTDLLTPSVIPRVIEEIRLASSLEAYLEAQRNLLRQREKATSQITGALDLAGFDVYLFIVESYGHTVFARDDYFRVVRDDFHRYDADLSAAGFSVVSSFLDSPVFGGNSWLAEATIETGIWVIDQDIYELLLETRVRTLAGFFGEAGYRTVHAMPATVPPWPEGAFYGFTRHYYAGELGYRGPSFGWAPTSDQFVLEFIRREEISTADMPLFIQYSLVSTHFPFLVVPKYFDDWTKIADGSIYHDPGAVVHFSERDASGGYMTAVRYVLQVLMEYILRFIHDDSLVIVVGDHQPWVKITGKNQLWSVPIHAISRNEDHLRPFRTHDYTEGLVPRHRPPHAGLDTLFHVLLEGFSSAPIGDLQPPP